MRNTPKVYLLAQIKDKLHLLAQRNTQPRSLKDFVSQSCLEQVSEYLSATQVISLGREIPPLLEPAEAKAEV